MPLDQARWQIDIMAADKTAQAFQSVDKRIKSLDQSTKAMSFGRGLAEDVKGMLGLVTRFAPVLTGAALAWKTFNAGMKAADLGEQADQIGLTTDQLQAYRFVATQAGVSNEELDAGMMRLTRAMGEASSGSDEMIARFDKLGVKLLNAEGQLRRPAEILPELATGLLQVRSETERNAMMMDLFGRSGSRMVTMLQSWAQGNDEMIRSAQSMGAIVSPENIAKWDKLGDSLARSKINTDAMLATLAAPAAGAAADMMERLAKNTERAVQALNALPADATFFQKLEAIFGKDTNTMGGLRLSTPPEKAMDELEAAQKRLTELEVMRSRASGIGANTLTDQIERQRALVARLEAGYRAAAKQAENAAAMQRLLDDGLPARSGVPSSGKGQPAGKAAVKAGESIANKQFADSQQRLNDLVAESSKEFERAQELIIRYGDGTAYAAAEMEKLNDLLPYLKDQPDVLSRMMDEINQRAAEMERSFHGAQGGIEGFAAGIQQGFADMAIANREFEYGKMAVDAISESLKILAGTSNKSFGEVALNFAAMVAQMELQAQASSVWRSLGGSSVVTDLFGGIGNLFSSGASSSPFNVGGDIIGGTYADGGRPPVGRLSLVGEEGPELWVPDRPGTILNQEQVAALGGGRTTVIVQQTVQVGEYVTSTEYRRGLDATRRAAMEGAQAALLSRRRAGDVRVKGVFG